MQSLCNACGIRQRKARRAKEAAAAAANGAAAVATDAATSMKIKVHNKKEKKLRITSHVGQYKKQFKVHSDNYISHPHHHQSHEKKLCFKEFALSLSKNSALHRVFPQDVEDAAILLMELSCGLVHTWFFFFLPFFLFLWFPPNKFCRFYEGIRVLLVFLCVTKGRDIN